MLVVEEQKKELIWALVTNQIAAEEGTDLMSGKGNDLFILLQGGLGTGKTLMAESVTEIAQKPLYRVTCGDVGTNAEDVGDVSGNRVTTEKDLGLCSPAMYSLCSARWRKSEYTRTQIDGIGDQPGLANLIWLYLKSCTFPEVMINRQRLLDALKSGKGLTVSFLSTLSRSRGWLSDNFEV